MNRPAFLTLRNSHGFRRGPHRPGQNAAFRVRGVEGWRGVAALGIVVVHAWQLMDTDGDGQGPGSPGVVLGMNSFDLLVDLFFVLSGLLLFLPFAAAAVGGSGRAVDGDDFLWRRVLRFLPTYWLLVLICWSFKNYGVTTADWLDLVEHITLTHAFDSDRIFNTIGPAWTLSVEWVFYLTLAVCAPAWSRWARQAPTEAARAGRLLWPLLPVLAASLLYKLNVDFVWDVPLEEWAWRFGPAAKADIFAIGMALAVVMVLLKERGLPSPVCLVALVGGVWMLWEARVTTILAPETVLESLRHTVSALGWALVLLSVMAARTPLAARAVDNALTMRLSVLAYTIYIVHEPVGLGLEHLGLISVEGSGFLLNVLLMGSLSIFAAWVLHRVWEEPWADVGALRAKGGGRKDLYADLEMPPLEGEDGPHGLRDRIHHATGRARSSVEVMTR